MTAKRPIFHRVPLILVTLVSLLIFACPSPVAPPGETPPPETPQVATPAISASTPNPIQQDSATISITCSTSGAAIYYTTDGSTPSASSNHYTAAFAIDSFAVVGTPLTIKAIGILSGSTDSTVASADFTVVDTEGPIPVITGPAAANAPFTVTITFNEDVTGFDDSATDIEIPTANATAGAIAGGPRVYTSLITPSGASAETVTVNIPAGACVDEFANNSVASASPLSVVFDPTAPLGVITSTESSPTRNSPIPISIDFGRDVTGFDAGDITVGNGSVSGSVSGGPQVYTASILPAGQGVVTVDIAAGVCNATTPPNTENLASATFSITYDTVGPDVTIDQAATQNDPTNGTVDFTVVFTEAVTDFNSGCVALSGTAGATTPVVTGSGATYNVAVSGMSTDGTVIATINADVAHDAAGNGNNASTSTDNTVTYDATPPEVTIDQAAAQADPTNGSPVNFTVVFSESVADFAGGDVSLSGTAGATTATVTGSGTTYNVAVSGMTGDGTVIASIASGVAHDAAGNGNNASTSTDNTVNYDASGPSVTINQAAAQADPTNGSPINFTVVFSESVSDFATGDVDLSGTAGATTATVTGSGTTYNVAVSGMAGDGTVIATIPADAAHDGLNNGNAASTSTDNTVTYDTTGPSVTINQAAAQADPTNGSPIDFTVVFSESVTGFTGGDVALSGTANPISATVTGSGTTYNVAVSGMTGDGTVIASVNLNAATDAAGNDSEASTSTDNTVTYDTTGPTVTINQAVGQADPTNASPINFTVVFSEAVSDFATGNVTLSGTAGATTGTVTGSGTTYNVAVSGMTGDGTVIAGLLANVAHDAAGNGNDASTSTDNTVTYDTTGPTVTIEQAAAQNDPTNASPISFTVVFSESVTGFATGDVTISGTAGGTMTAAISGSGANYTVSVTGMTSKGTVIASIDSDVCTDAAGNNNAASTSTDNTVSWFNSATMLGSWTANTGASFAVPTQAGSNRILLVVANARRSVGAVTHVTGIVYGGQALTMLSERTYNTTAPTVCDSVWYLNEAGIAAATSTTLTITWSSAPTVQQNWARFISTVDQTTPYANVQGGDSTATTVTTTAAVNYTPGTIGYATEAGITTAEGVDSVSGITTSVDVQETASGTFEAAIADTSFTTSGSFTPTFTISTANKQTCQAFVIVGY